MPVMRHSCGQIEGCEKRHLVDEMHAGIDKLTPTSVLPHIAITRAKGSWVPPVLLLLQSICRFSEIEAWHIDLYTAFQHSRPF